jgi:TonB family protein
VKAFMAAAQKGDADGMTKLFSNKGIQKTGLDKIKSNNQLFAEMLQRASAAGESYRMAEVQETSLPEGKRVAFFYKNEAGTNSLKLVFDLSKEGPAWKIDEIGGVEKEQIGNVDQPAPGDSLRESVPPPPSPPQTDQVSSASPNNGPTPTNRAPISGGVLNGIAINLPTPAYPAIGMKVKAHGTVVVEVLVDENGDVISARAKSGHPLLQAASVAAAMNAKFPPRKQNGVPVKVSGVINYTFEAH